MVKDEDIKYIERHLEAWKREISFYGEETELSIKNVKKLEGYLRKITKLTHNIEKTKQETFRYITGYM